MLRVRHLELIDALTRQVAWHGEGKVDEKQVTEYERLAEWLTARARRPEATLGDGDEG